MLSTTMVLAATMLGVDTGWQPVENGNGGLEYIIQIEPELLEALQNGERITSEIPAEVHGVRRYRIVVGNETLPREGASDQTALKPPATGKPTLPPDMPARMPTVASDGLATDRLPTAAGGLATDAGGLATDAGGLATDAGGFAPRSPAGSDSRGPADAGLRPADAGLRPVDAGLRPSDAGLRPPDAGPRPSDAGLRPSDAGLRPPAVDRARELELDNPRYPGPTFVPRGAPLPAAAEEPAPLPAVAGDAAGALDPLPASDLGSRYGGGESPAATEGPRPFATDPPRDLKMPLRSTPLGPAEPAVSWPTDHDHDHGDDHDHGHAASGAGDLQPNRLAAYDETDRSVAASQASPGDVPAATASSSSAVPPGMGKWMLALGALFASLAANFYLGWVTWDTRQRYRDLVYERQGET